MEGHPSSSSTETKKRACGDVDSLDSPGLKRVKESDSFLPRNDSSVSVVSQVDSGNAGDDADEFASPEVAKLRKDILDILEEPEMVPETQELDSVIRSFEEEILQSKNVQVTPFPGEPQPDLGFLLGASDDELGLPPSSTTVFAGEETKTQPEPDSLGNALDDVAGFQDELLPGCDPFELDIEDVLGFGLFDEVNGSECSDLAWQPESLPAV